MTSAEKCKREYRELALFFRTLRKERHFQGQSLTQKDIQDVKFARMQELCSNIARFKEDEQRRVDEMEREKRDRMRKRQVRVSRVPTEPLNQTPATVQPSPVLSVSSPKRKRRKRGSDVQLIAAGFGSSFFPTPIASDRSVSDMTSPYHPSTPSSQCRRQMADLAITQSLKGSHRRRRVSDTSAVLTDVTVRSKNSLNQLVNQAPLMDFDTQGISLKNDDSNVTHSPLTSAQSRVVIKDDDINSDGHLSALDNDENAQPKKEDSNGDESDSSSMDCSLADESMIADSSAFLCSVNANGSTSSSIASSKSSKQRKRRVLLCDDEKQHDSKTKKSTRKKRTRKPKKDGAPISSNFVKLDLRHRYSRRGRSSIMAVRKGHNNRVLSKKQYYYQKLAERKKESMALAQLDLHDDLAMARAERGTNSSDDDDGAQCNDGTLHCDENNVDHSAMKSAAMLDATAVCPSDENEKLSPSIPSINGSESDEELQNWMDQALSDHWGYSSFREGQIPAIKAILRGQSSVVLLPTGGGKSLCYQMPAYFFRSSHSVTLVVSPLVSLMQDQCESLPSCVRGAVWNHTLDREQIINLRRELVDGKVDILYVSPEKLDAANFRMFLSQKIGHRLKFACIDEAHCISEWSHNFRPAYLRLRQLLKDHLRIDTLLACTATATRITLNAIVENLGMDPLNVVSAMKPRTNLHLTVSHCTRLSKMNDLLSLLGSPRFIGLKSLIVYVALKADCEVVCARLSSKLAGLRGMRVEQYHGGMASELRREILSDFMANRIQIVVATIAFGMGLDKSDVRGVIHYSLPKSMEHFVQEVGRAGRDGLPAECHLFLDSEDVTRALSWIYTDGVDLSQIREFLGMLFIRTNRNRSKNDNDGNKDVIFVDHGTVIAVPDSKEFGMKLDMKPTVVHTILTYLDIYQRDSVKMLPKGFDLIRVGLLRGTQDSVLSQDRVLEYLFENVKQRKNGMFTTRVHKLLNGLREYYSHELDAAKKSPSESSDDSTIRSICTLSGLMAHLKQLQKDRLIRMELDDRCYFVLIRKSVESLSQMNALCKVTYDYLCLHERVALEKVNTLTQSLKLVAFDDWNCENRSLVTMKKEENSDVDEKSESHLTLHKLVDSYFECDTHDDYLDLVQSYLAREEHIREEDVSKDHWQFQKAQESLKQLSAEHPCMRPRALARILHGIHSPMYSFRDWKENPMWKSHHEFPFLQLVRIAEELLRRDSADGDQATQDI